MQQADRVRLRLEAEGRAGLYELLSGAAGRRVGGRYVIAGVFAAGGQGVLFDAVDEQTGQRVLVKQASFDYRRPIAVSRRDAARARGAIEAEHRALGLCTTMHMPRAIALLCEGAVVPAADSSNVLGKGEVFLVLEPVAGRTLEQVALDTWPHTLPSAREAAARRVASEFMAFFGDLLGKGYFYGDINATNILIDEVSGRVRFVDAACVVEAGPSIVLRECTPAFLTPRLFEAVTEGRPVPCGFATALPMLGKVLHYALTRLQPFNGAMPDHDAPELNELSGRCRRALRAMTLADGDPAAGDLALEALGRWLAS